MKETYTVNVVCTNCRLGIGFGGAAYPVELEVEKGKTVQDQPCPRCGCKRLRVN